MSLSKEVLQELETKHRRVAHVRGKPIPGETEPSWEIVLRRPSRAEYRQFRSRNHNPATVADAQEALVRQCTVFPSPDALDALFEEWPAIPEAASGALLRLMGLAVEEDSPG